MRQRHRRGVSHATGALVALPVADRRSAGPLALSACTPAELRAWIADHAAALDAACGDNPFNSAAWWLAWLEHVADPAWRCHAVPLAPGEGAALLRAGAASPRRLQALNNYYASLYAPLAGVPTPTFASPSLARVEPSPAVLQVAPLDAAVAARLQHRLGSQGFWVRRYFCHGNWTLPCEGLGFDAYMAARPSRLRRTWQRKSRQWQGAGVGTRLQIATAPAEVDAAMAAYETVYARSWKEAEASPAFVRAWAHACAARGWLRLGIAWVGDVPVAAQFWFVVQRRACIFKLAYDDGQARWSAGTLLSAHLFRHALDVDRVAEIDYLTGDDAYKPDWMTHRRERHGLLACNPRTLAGLARIAFEWPGARLAARRARAESC